MTGEAAAWLACQYFYSHNLFVKNNIQVVYMHMWLTFNSVLKGFLNERVSYLIGVRMDINKKPSDKAKISYLLMHLFCLIYLLKCSCWSSNSWAPWLYGMGNIHHCFRLTCLHLQNSCPHLEVAHGLKHWYLFIKLHGITSLKNVVLASCCTQSKLKKWWASLILQWWL